MLDTFFTQIKVRSRMEGGPIGPYLSEIAAMLHRNGYARSTIRRHLRAADRFGAWILKEGMSIVDINASIVDRYLEGLGRQFFPSRYRDADASDGQGSAAALSLRMVYDLAAKSRFSLRLNFKNLGQK
jgi:hypothetical protein